jgi:hypothetical protein
MARRLGIEEPVRAFFPFSFHQGAIPKAAAPVARKRRRGIKTGC